jgi:multidrug resistance efflux pump
MTGTSVTHDRFGRVFQRQANAAADPKQAKAQVAQAMADVTQAQANQRRTELAVSRHAPLAKDVSVSQQEFDNTGEQILSRIGGNSHD